MAFIPIIDTVTSRTVTVEAANLQAALAKARRLGFTRPARNGKNLTKLTAAAKAALRQEERRVTATSVFNRIGASQTRLEQSASRLANAPKSAKEIALERRLTAPPRPGRGVKGLAGNPAARLKPIKGKQAKLPFAKVEAKRAAASKAAARAAKKAAEKKAALAAEKKALGAAEETRAALVARGGKGLLKRALGFAGSRLVGGLAAGAFAGSVGGSVLRAADLGGQRSAANEDLLAQAPLAFSEQLRQQRLQAALVANEGRLLATSPQLYNELTSGQRLPEGAIPFGGPVRRDMLDQVLQRMAQGGFR